MSPALIFHGRIAGWGTSSGTRVVVGRWDRSPFGLFADVMVERPDGERLLLAPTAEVAELVASTYRFDRVEVVAVRVVDVEVVDVEVTDVEAPPGGTTGGTTGETTGGSAGRRTRLDRVPRPWQVSAGPLEARLVVGRRTGLGHALRAVPDRVAGSRRFTTVTDPVARALMHGVRTRGSAGSGRVEHYGATDVHALDEVTSSWDGEPLGNLTSVDPPVRFGFGSTPRRPAVTDVVTTIVLPDGGGDVA
ncbi:hypothetical protein [Cellulosimicrobium sp. Marseille-Q4280]|uniref:hypothetical protein n=1 Tax=Cellulosimicrobium sp. Marseille-Q4280 TaxID=2937992 RepID=UPI00203AD01A|nr:hypothetical protein [Cellulosimicrobium sp. Marseille-Q4280]